MKSATTYHKVKIRFSMEDSVLYFGKGHSHRRRGHFAIKRRLYELPDPYGYYEVYGYVKYGKMMFVVGGLGYDDVSLLGRWSRCKTHIIKLIMME